MTGGSTAAAHCGFEDIQLQVGDRVQLEMVGDPGRPRYFTTLIGYVGAVSVLVSTPVRGDSPIAVMEGDRVLVRAFSGRDAFAFESTVIRSSRSPFAYLHLAYPGQVRRVPIRGAFRVRADLPATALNAARDPEGTPRAGVLSDLSVTGAQFDSDQAFGGGGEKWRLFFRFTLAPAGYEVRLSADAVVQSCRKVEDGRAGTDVYRHGLRFEGMRSTEALLLQSFVQQVMLDDRSRLA